MKRILLCHDGAELSANATIFLHQELHNANILDILYVIPQNLVHYGQVDQLATPDSKQEFINYVQELGVQECKERLGNFVENINTFAKNKGFNLNTQMHVRWGNATEAIKEIVHAYNSTSVFIPCKVWNIDWKLQKNIASKLNIHEQALHII